jgi:hypothetical protein
MPLTNNGTLRTIGLSLLIALFNMSSGANINPIGMRILDKIDAALLSLYTISISFKETLTLFFKISNESLMTLISDLKGFDIVFVFSFILLLTRNLKLLDVPGDSTIKVFCAISE